MVSTSNPGLEQLRNLLNPEVLEDSKIVSILTENLTFKLEDLHNLKEIAKIFPKIEDLSSALSTIEYISSTNNIYSINIDPNFSLYSLLNVPSSINKKQDLLKILKIEEASIKRLYKKNFFVWYLITDLKASDRSTFENNLRVAQFGEEKLKFDVYNDIYIKKNLTKAIHNNSGYHKETTGLKAPTSNASTAQPGSWRKKSNDSSDEFFDV